MKVLPPGLQDHLDGGSTTMIYCWRITRRDGEVQGFTEHDEDITFAGTTFKAASGFTASAIDTELGLNVDSMNADGALSDDTINEEDLAAGRYDGAQVELFWANFLDTSQRVLISRGSIGEVKRGQTAFSAELRSLTHLLQQKTGRTYQRYCDADLGDERCKVNLEASQFSSTGTVTSAEANRVLTVSGISNNAADFYALGKLTFTSGANEGLTFTVKLHSIRGGVTSFSLWEPTPFDVQSGDTFNVFAGCSKAPETCKAKFNNFANFQGFPHVPGNDHVSKYPTRGGSDQNGGSIFR
ncbi:DUF2163 domain-containing protein [Brucella abortus]|uniref:DUF2163 domain-containing protein n=1 Tax=Brucella abortus TaxID=235 RepID=UPI0004E8AE65|nr:DUF2163 domain-containing protein [Brucella abortus]KFH18439.1 hypothetical protein IB60_17175 [Brucella abortus LMN1]RUQ67330.1 DUF2163 domain-containing protein [Brucella abortus]RUQ77943.1 DUF2163 domain-containing protein [Brucella abortus]RUQ88281.1 DUF2163 domain-containing protein [Brucella abortus]RUQ90310.1 DUF2163 domain-containing protein [Brucella abortus]